MEELNLQIIKLKLFLKANLAAVLAVFLAVVLAAGLAVYWFTVKKPAETEKEKEKIVSEEEARKKILESLTAPLDESKLTPEEENKLLNDLSAPEPNNQTTQKLKEENKELFDALSAPK